MGSAAAMAATAVASVFPGVEDLALVRIGGEVLPASIISRNGSMTTVRPLQAYRGRNMRKAAQLKWRKNPAGARANYVVDAADIASGAFQLTEGGLPAHIDCMVTTELGAPEQAAPQKAEPVQVPQLPFIPPTGLLSASSSFGQMPAISETRPQAPKGEFTYGKEMKELRTLGFAQESRLRAVLSDTQGSVEQSLQKLNARRRFKYPTAFSEIKQMGFSNDEVIKALLMKHHGHKEAVVFEMLG